MFCVFVTPMIFPRCANTRLFRDITDIQRRTFFGSTGARAWFVSCCAARPRGCFASVCYGAGWCYFFTFPSFPISINLAGRVTIVSGCVTRIACKLDGSSSCSTGTTGNHVVTFIIVRGTSSSDVATRAFITGTTRVTVAVGVSISRVQTITTTNESRRASSGD